MPTIGIRTATTRLTQLVDQAAAGEEVIIAREGRPAARPVPIAERKPALRRHLGILAGQASVPADFDAPLPETVLATFERR